MSVWKHQLCTIYRNALKYRPVGGAGQPPTTNAVAIMVELLRIHLNVRLKVKKKLLSLLHVYDF